VRVETGAAFRLAGTDRGTSEFSEGHGHHIEDLGGRQANPDALPNAGSAYVAEQVGGGGFEGRNFRFLRRQRCGLQIDWPRGIGRFRFVGIEDLGRVDNFRPQGEQDPRLRNDVEDRFGGQVESRLRLGRDAIGQVSQKRSHQKWLSWSVMSSPTSTGRIPVRGRKRLGRNDVADVGEHGAKPGQTQAVAEQEADIHRP